MFSQFSFKALKNHVCLSPYALEKEMATHSSVLAWEIPRPEEPGRPQIHGVGITACLRLLVFLLAVLIPACASSSPAFWMMYSAYKLNKQGDNIRPWHQFSRSVMSDSLLLHGPQHARPPCPSPVPGACSNSCPLNWWCHPTISSSVVAFSCLQSFPASGCFPVNQFFTSGGQRIGASASCSRWILDTVLSQFWTNPLFHVQLTIASWLSYRFLRRQVKWSGITISLRIFQLVVIHTVNGFSVVNEAEVEVFLEFACLCLWSSGCWQFDLWFLCLFSPYCSLLPLRFSFWDNFSSSWNFRD